MGCRGRCELRKDCMKDIGNESVTVSEQIVSSRVESNAMISHGVVILHSRADDVIPFADSLELVRNSGLLTSALIVVGNDHRLADQEPLEMMLMECEGKDE